MPASKTRKSSKTTTTVVLPTLAQKAQATKDLVPFMLAYTEAETGLAVAQETVTAAMGRVGSFLSVEKAKYGKGGEKAFSVWACKATGKGAAWVARSLQVAIVQDTHEEVLASVPSADAVARFSTLTGEGETEKVLRILKKEKSRGTETDVRKAIATVKAQRVGAETEAQKKAKRITALAKRLKKDADRAFKPYKGDHAALTAAVNLAAWASETGVKCGALTPDAIRASMATALADCKPARKQKATA